MVGYYIYNNPRIRIIDEVGDTVEHLEERQVENAQERNTERLGLGIPTRVKCEEGLARTEE